MAPKRRGDRDVALRPFDSKALGHFGYRRLTAAERALTAAAAVALLALLSRPRGPWRSAAGALTKSNPKAVLLGRPAR